jgi:HEAT repeat protein
MLNDAFEALKKYDYGTDRSAVDPIADAAARSHGNADARRELETQLLAILGSDVSRDAREYICRILTVVGTAASIPPLAGMLGDEAHSHMARMVLERMAIPEAGVALREALEKVSGKSQAGIIGSLGSRQESAAVPALAKLLREGDAVVSRAAVNALGQIGTAAAVAALRGGVKLPGVVDALLHCAEAHLASGKTVEARQIYDLLAGDENPRLVRLAATRGILACAAKSG